MSDYEYLVKKLKFTRSSEDDIKFFFKTMEEFGIKEKEIVKHEEEFLGNKDLYYLLHDLHVIQLRKKLVIFCEKLESNNDHVIFNKEKLESYKVDIISNFSCTVYDNEYEFWYAKDLVELKEYYAGDFSEFLVEEEIVSIEYSKEDKKKIIKEKLTLVKEVVVTKAKRDRNGNPRYTIDLASYPECEKLGKAKKNNPYVRIFQAYASNLRATLSPYFCEPISIKVIPR